MAATVEVAEVAWAEATAEARVEARAVVQEAEMARVEARVVGAEEVVGAEVWGARLVCLQGRRAVGLEMGARVVVWEEERVVDLEEERAVAKRVEG